MWVSANFNFRFNSRGDVLGGEANCLGGICLRGKNVLHSNAIVSLIYDRSRMAARMRSLLSAAGAPLSRGGWSRPKFLLLDNAVEQLGLSCSESYIVDSKQLQLLLAELGLPARQRGL